MVPHIVLFLLFLSVSADSLEDESSAEYSQDDHPYDEIYKEPPPSDNYYNPPSSSDSYSYVDFSGPVSGNLQEIVVDGPTHYVDYMAKPDYTYRYGVQDPQAGISQAHQETRNGDAVTGEYRVLQADGLMRVVTYTAGKNGFQANVHYEPAS